MSERHLYKWGPTQVLKHFKEIFDMSLSETQSEIKIITFTHV